MNKRLKTWSVLWLALAAACALGAVCAGPAAAGSGTSYEVPLVSTPPTIDGNQGQPEWDSAVSFPVVFGGVTGTAYVERTATNLYVAYQVTDPTGAGADAAVYFDNVDNGTLDVGDDLLGLPTSAGAQDSYISSVDFPSYNSFLDIQAPGGGSSDVRAAAAREGSAVFVEFEHALCANDPGHDICFIPPAPSGDASRIGFDLFYNGVGNDGLGVGSIGGWPNLQISPTPDTTPPSAPTLSVESSDAYYAPDSSVLWYRGNAQGEFTFVADGTDPESGIASATFPGVSDLGGGWDTGSNPTPTSLNYFFPDSSTDPAPTGTFKVTLTNGAGLEGAPTNFTFATDAEPPTGGITCVPASCTNDGGPVTVKAGASDAGSGLRELRYTTDGSAPNADHGTAIEPGGSFEITSPNATVNLWGVDNVGNEDQLATVEVSGSFATQPNGSILYESTRPSAADSTVSTIWQVAPGTGTESQLTTAPAELHVAVAGDGSKIAWTGTNVDGGSFIVVANRDGSNAQAITGGPGDDWPAISPDGTKIAYSHDVGNGIHDVYVAGIDGENPVDVSGGATSDDLRPSWSPDGTQLVYAGSNGLLPDERTPNYDIYVQNAQAGASRTDLTPTQDSVERDPSWSPKGTLIAFSSNSGHTWPQVWVMDPSGGNQVDLTDSYAGFNDGGDQNSDPAFSPDGTQIAFVFSPGGTQAFDVFTMNSDRTKRTRLFTNGTHEGYPAWAPAQAQGSATITVNTAADHDDGACTVDDCTLREAINAANAAADANTIAFAIPGDGEHTIALGTPLPPLTDGGTTIDGYTQPGATPNTIATGDNDNAARLILLDGTFIVGGVDPAALEIQGAANTIQGLIIGSPLGAGFNKGIRVTGAAAESNVIRGNELGPNRIDGVDVRAGASNTTIGGLNTDSGRDPAAQNVIKDNGDAGVSVSSSGSLGGPATRATHVEGNFIAGNRQGVLLQDGSTTASVRLNDISLNTENGVAVADGPDGTTSHNEIAFNSIHDNGALGIDLGMDGATPNDAGDVDGGPNDLQNFPTLSPPLLSGTSISLAVRLDSRPGTRYRIEIFTSTTCDASGSGEGETTRATPSLTTDATGVGITKVSFDIGTATVGGVTALATDLDQHQTSEFSSCRAPSVTNTASASVTLTAGSPSSEAGASSIDLGFLRTQRGAFAPQSTPIESSPIESSPIESSPIESSPIESSPIESSPIESSPIESSPIESSPIESSPIESSGFTSTNLRQNALGGVPLSDLPLLHGKTWATVLGRDVPEQSTTLADALALNPRPAGLNTLTVGDIDWAHSSSALASLGVGVFALGSAPLSHIQPLADWCTAINAAQGFSCDKTNAADLAKLGTETVMDVGLQGIPIESSGLGTAPIESSDLSGTPIESSPIESSDLAGTPIESSPLSDVDLSVSPLGAIPLSAVLAPNANSPLGTIPTSLVPAGVLSCTACGTTLAAAKAFVGTKTVADLGPALAHFTIGDLKVYPNVTFGNIGQGLPSYLTIRDLLRALFAHVPFDPETLPLDGIQTVAESGGLVTYTATIALTGTGDGGFAELDGLIDPSARYKPGSTTFSLNGTVLAHNDPGVLADGKLAWALNGLTYGQTYTLRFQVYPGLQLGSDTTQVTLLPVGAPSATSTAVPVAVTDTFEAGSRNDTPATATTVQADHLYLSFEQTQADTDWFKLAVPPSGTVTTVTLSHLTNDKDLVVYAPNGQQLRSAPIESSPIESSPIESSPVLDPLPTLRQGQDHLQPAAVQDVPIESSQLSSNVVAGVSDNAGTSIDTVTLVSTSAGGSYLIHVVNSDSTPTTKPYALHINEDAPAPPAPCPTARTFANAGQGQAGALPSLTATPAAKTLILVDYKRYGDTYGLAAENTLKTKLQALAARAEVAGVIVPVEGDSQVQAAYTAWDTQAHQCLPDYSNAVVGLIGSRIIDPFRAAHAGVKFLVIVGGDDIIPFPRVPDMTTTSNERDYVGTIGFPKNTLGNAVPTNNQLVGTAVSSYMQTDDVWSAFNPSPFLVAPLYLPQWATGRLVETPAQIGTQLDAYQASGGAINPTTSLTAGYGFLSDSAGAVAGLVQPFAPGATLDGSWTGAQLTTALHLGTSSPALVTVNAHYDHHRLLAGNLTDLVGSQPFAAANAELGRLIFSIGCHSGYGVPNFLYASPFSLDWPEADFAAGAIARVGNTTYGYGDTIVIGYSEGVEVEFAKRLRQASLGEALEFAKQQYVANLAAIGPYEQKAVNALTFYGLPMQHIGLGTGTTTPTPPATSTDAVTGLQSFPVVSNVTFGSPVSTGDGQYFNGPDGVDATNNRPFEPKKIVPDITVPGLIPHGFLITGLGLDAPHVGFTAARSRAIPDSHDLTPPLSSEVGWPSNLSRISSFLSPTGPRQQLVLIHGQFLSDSADTAGTGTQTNFNQISGKVLYSTSNDALPPQLANIHVTKVPTGVAFELDATDATSPADTNLTGTVKEVLVAYFEQGASAAHIAVLSRTGTTTHWSGGGPLAGSVDSINYFIQAVDAAGNVGLSVHKVIAAPIVLQQASAGHIAVAPGPPPSGWFAGSTQVSITADPGYALSYSVDGGAVKPYTGSFAVSGDGVHLVDAFSDNGAGDAGRVTAAIPIDAAAPVVSILSPADGSYALLGGVVKALYSCTDAGSGLDTTNGCVGTVAVGANIDTATVGTKTFTVNTRDALGHTRSVSVTYRVWKSPGDAIVALADKTVQYLKGNPLSLALKASLTIVANAVVTRNQPLACATLNGYIQAVKGASSSVLTQAQKDDLVADATRIKVLIGCS